MRIHKNYKFKKKSKIPLAVAVGICLLIGHIAISTSDKAEGIDKTPNKTKTEIEDVRASQPTPRELVIKYSNLYGIEPTLALAISRLETGNFSSKAFIELNNFGGMQVNGHTLKYSSKEEGIKAFIENLKYNYIDLGLTTPKEIGRKYCPDVESWGNEVEKIMGEENERLQGI